MRKQLSLLLLKSSLALTAIFSLIALGMETIYKCRLQFVQAPEQVRQLLVCFHTHHTECLVCHSEVKVFIVTKVADFV